MTSGVICDNSVSVSWKESVYSTVVGLQHTNVGT